MSTRAKASSAKKAKNHPETDVSKSIDSKNKSKPFDRESDVQEIPPSGVETIHEIPTPSPRTKKSPRSLESASASPTRGSKSKKKSLESLKAEMTALKHSNTTQPFTGPQPKPKTKMKERQGTPLKNTSHPTPSTPTSPGKEILPLKYSQLLELFKHLQMVHRLRKSKEAFLTFADAKAAIQAASHKPFTIKHLAKMKFMIPEILQWEYMEAAENTPASKRLVIRLETRTSNNKEMEDSKIYADFRERLVSHARRAALIGKESDDIPEAEIPDPALCTLVSDSKALSGRSWSNSSSGFKSRSPASVKSRHKGVSLTPAKRAGMSPPVFLTPRRLTTVTERSGEVVGETSLNSIKTPCKSVRDSIFSPCSTNRDALRETFKRRLLMSPRKVKERERSQAIAHLITTLNDVRAVFQQFKTTLRPVDEVLEAMSQLAKSNYTLESAKLHLQMLLEYAPQYVKLQTGDNSKDVLVIDKSCNLPAIREMLKEAAKNRPKVDVDDSEVEKHIERVFEVLDF